VAQVSAASGVSQVTATLVLRDTTFNGQLPDSAAAGSSSTAQTGRPSAGSGQPAFGGGNFDVNSSTVEGITPGATALGPLSGATVSSGRGFAAADAGQDVALISSTYASSKSLAVGGTVTVKGTAMTIVGVLSASTSTTSLSDVYLPLDVAQTLSGLTGQVTNLYVQAAGSNAVSTAAAAITKALPDATVTTQADLASSVTGSLSSAASLVRKLGTWLAVAVLVAAFVLAVLFTISGVTRRTRDFGTLKSIGWSNGRIVRQVGTESLVQGLIGGVVGLVVGLAGIAVINAVGISLSGTTGAAATAQAAAPPEGAGAGAGAFGGGTGRGFAQAASSTVNVVLHAPVDVAVVILGIGLAVAGGLLAGVIGGWRASRLQPAAALRSLD
jgi:ABC-type antimicrobial peptide transport system permease subunit